MTETLHALAGFQREAVAALGEAMADIARRIERWPGERHLVALRNGGMLLDAPTGSGKTLMLGRALEASVGALPARTVWFWFTPYAGLVAQTRSALAAQCPRLTLRDLARDREAVLARDGDVFISTWAAVARNNPGTLRARSGSESLVGLDAMLGALRADGFLIGAVIDEAHLNFGASAAAAARFYLDVLRPDFTLLATATPNDARLAEFERAAGVGIPNRVTIARGDVVEAGLNKLGLVMGLLRFKPEDAALIDPEQATLIAGWRRHQAIAARLAERGIGLTPLMLVQVEDREAGGEDPVERVEQHLRAAGVPADVIRAHTSGEPDPDFHSFAYDPHVQVLIFKVAVATGFDAPRAWTLVSVRPNRGREFGLQVVGRIMRVHPLVRPIHGHDALLDRGYVFLTDPELQQGLDAAAEALKAVRQGITLVTDRLEIEEIGSAAPLGIADRSSAFAATPLAPGSEDERRARLAALIERRIVFPEIAALDRARQDQAIATGEQLVGGALFDAWAERRASVSVKPAYTDYPLQAALGVPTALWQERALLPHELNSEAFLAEIARRFCAGPGILVRLRETQRRATVSLRDLFLGETGEESVSVRLSDARVAEQAQRAFEFNDSIEARRLKPALVRELRRVAEAANLAVEESDLRRAVALQAMLDPDSLKTAIKQAQGRLVTTNPVELPGVFPDEAGRPEARLSAYGMFPSRMNKPERRIAGLLDADESDTVAWWLRNVENMSWAARILLPNGRAFYPDFVVGVRGRRTVDQIALVEVKDDGVDGRLHADINLIKIRTPHRDYRDVAWTAEGERGMELLRLNEGLGRIQADRPFAVQDLRG